MSLQIRHIPFLVLMATWSSEPPLWRFAFRESGVTRMMIPRLAVYTMIIAKRVCEVERGVQKLDSAPRLILLVVGALLLRDHPFTKMVALGLSAQNTRAQLAPL